jgi:hypothetical protein
LRLQIRNKVRTNYRFGALGGSISGASVPTPGGKAAGLIAGIRHTFLT